MKKLIGMTMVSLMAMVSSIQGAPIDSVTMESDYTEAQAVGTVSNITDSVVTSYTGYMDELSTIALMEEHKDCEGAVSIVVDEQAKVRDIPSAEGNIVQFINEATPVFVKEQIDNFYLVEVEGEEGYIYIEQLDREPLEEIPYTRSEANTIVEEVYLGEEIVERAKQYLGNPYVYGGTSLTNGADCSGFTQQVFKQFGINIQRSSRSQYASNGYSVSKNDLLPGDLVFYGYNGYIDHVAIYAGNGQIVHASTPKTGICMGELNYGKPIIGIKRVI